MLPACVSQQCQVSRCAIELPSCQLRAGRGRKLGARVAPFLAPAQRRSFSVSMRSQQTEGSTESRNALDGKAGGPAPKPPGKDESTKDGVASSSNGTEDVDKQLSALWEDMKQQMKKDADPESAQLIDQLSYEELIGPNSNNFFRRLADAQLGPILSAMGVNEDPFDFFIEVIKLATFLQFVTCGMLFYGTELWGHLDAGAALRCTAGLALGYLSRPFFKVEQLLYPIYNGVLRLFLPNATYEVPPSSRSETTATLNKVGIFVALTFLLPQLFWGWDSSTSTTFVAPLSLGWLLFDASYMGALLVLLRNDNE